MTISTFLRVVALVFQSTLVDQLDEEAGTEGRLDYKLCFEAERDAYSDDE